MKICLILLSVVLSISLTFAGEKPAADAWNSMLGEWGLTENDLGFRPQGYWTRYPDPQDIPYKALAFDHLFSQPQEIYNFVQVMALSVDDYLHPDYLSNEKHDGILKVAYYCGVRNATAQFRDYSASLWAEVDENEPLVSAVREIYRYTHRVYRFNAVGQASDFPLIERDLRKAVEPMDKEVQKAVARCVLNLLDAYKWVGTAMRNVDYKDALDCWRIRQLGETQFDGLEYFPQLEDCAQNMDMNSMYYAGYKLLQSSQVLADTLLAMKKSLKIDWKNQRLNIVTPIGRIVIAGEGKDEHRYSDALLVVDLGGKDIYYGSTGANPSLEIPVSLTVDLAGEDRYINEDEFIPSQGAGLFGAGMLLDLSGDDYYQSTRLSQGAAMLGIGILADMEGNDEYRMWTSGQGGAFFGVALAVDNQGDDKYFMWGDGQGYGGVGGVGSLVNRSGNDYYWCEPLAEKVFRPDYHSKEGKLNYSYSQGCGIGRRGDITDGHSWAGGMGTLIDLRGNDTYESANWSLGCGYWYGMGFCYDGGGNDTYKSASWGQGAGAHFCIGALIDEGGDDYHECWQEQSVGMGFGHDFTVALLLDRGGNDVYKLKDNGLGYAINMSQVFFFDTAGDDKYITGGKGDNYGWNNFKQNNPPVIGVFQCLFAHQICLFADLSGKDVYQTLEYPNGAVNIDVRMEDGKEGFFPASSERDSLANKRYYGLGRDFLDWTGPEIEAFREKMAKRFTEFKE